MTSGADQLLDGFFAAIEAGDVARIGGYYADDVAVWNNVARTTMTKTQSLKLLAYVTDRLADMRYEVVERVAHSDGVTQRHVLRGRVGEQDIESDVCIVFRITGDKITHIFEYLDSAAVAPLFTSG